MDNVYFGIQSTLDNLIVLLQNHVSNNNRDYIIIMLLFIDLGSPTCIDFVQSDQLVVVSYTTAKVLIYDVETSQPVVTLDSAITYGNI